MFSFYKAKGNLKSIITKYFVRLHSNKWIAEKHYNGKENLYRRIKRMTEKEYGKCLLSTTITIFDRSL